MRHVGPLRGIVSGSLHAALDALACFGAVNVLLGCGGGADRNDLWVAGRGVGPAAVGVLTLAWALARAPAPRLAPPWRARLHLVGALGLLALCLVDAWAVEALRRQGALGSAGPLSLSLLLALLFGWAAWRGPRPPARGAMRRVGRVAWAGGAGGVLVWLHLLTFGASDYTRPADAAVVLGAKVHADGRPSGALRDRTLTACALYRAGTVRTLVLSGGRDPRAPMSEPRCMERIALEAGVPAEALVLDETGVTSEASLAAVDKLVRERRWDGVLLVSHDAHLARLSLLARAQGVKAHTVPTRETGPWPKKPLFVLREVAAFGWHWLRTV
jgi:uncharacterized SAM-binding protein YcdF (DUF218 family)